MQFPLVIAPSVLARVRAGSDSNGVQPKAPARFRKRMGYGAGLVAMANLSEIEPHAQLGCPVSDRGKLLINAASHQLAYNPICYAKPDASACGYE